MEFTHLNSAGEAHMVDVGGKNPTHRVAKAQGTISMQPMTLNAIKNGSAKKGDVLATARIAAIMATKRTADLIPLCHSLAITKVSVDFTFISEKQLCCTASVECFGQTGVEMEALTAVSVGLLTIYDMCKAIEKAMVIENIHLLSKTGGKSGDWTYPAG